MEKGLMHEAALVGDAKLHGQPRNTALPCTAG